MSFCNGVDFANFYTKYRKVRCITFVELSKLKTDDLSMKFICYLLLFSVTALAQPFPQRIDSLMQTHVKPNEPGFALLVMQKGKVLLQKGYGLADIQQQTLISPQTNFRMASVSKQFTAMGIMMLEKAGKLSFEDNLLTFFPEFNTITGKAIKIKHLLTHSSGVWDYEELISATQKTQVLDADVLSLLKNKAETYFEPGTKFQYSNSGFCLLAMVIERVSGKPFAEFITQQIFEPLGMKNTFIYDATKPQVNRAMGYARGKNGEIMFSDQSITSATKGDGCVYTSLEDYQKWHKALLKNKFVDLEKTLALISHPIENQANKTYGLGWFFSKRADGSLEMSHTGSTCGFANIVVRIPKEKLLIVYFSNIANNSKPYKELFKLFQTLPNFPKAQLWDVESLTR